jgi:hypothetical protein
MNTLCRNMFIITLLLITTSAGRDLVLLGFNGQRAPAAEKTYDRILREHLSVTPGIQLIDQAQCQHFKRLINFDTHSVQSKDLIESLARYVKDTTYFAWGTVRELKVYPKRKYFFQAQIKGELSIDLTLYSFKEHSFSYNGTIKAVLYEDKGIIFFTPISRTIHISALEQTDMLEKLEYEAVKKTCQIISAAVGREIARNSANTDEGKGTAKAINEVLTTPNVAAPEIKKGAAGSDTAIGKPIADTNSAALKGTLPTEQSNK